MKSIPFFDSILWAIFIGNPFVSFCQQSNNQTFSIQIDGSRVYQQMDGIGVNANTSSWKDHDLEPALNLLLDSMHATVWRIIVETVEKWEEVNDNDDPHSFNWDYYNTLYETPKFQKAWDMIAYLNGRGISDKLMINFMGAIPPWMGGEVILEDKEDEYIEMVVSFFHYARHQKHLHFGLVSLMNEPDIRKEGPTVSPVQYARVLKKLIIRMQALGLGDIAYVAPDVAGMDHGVSTYIPEIMKDQAVMAKIAHLGLHSYGGYYADIDSMLNHSAYPSLTYWITEWNAWCNGCDDGKLGEYNYSFAGKSIGYLLDFIQHGATAALVWEGYDSYYEHHAPSPFSYWGMLAYDRNNKVYIPRKNFYALQQVAGAILPGSSRIALTGLPDSIVALAFYDSTSKRLSITGINKTASAIHITGTLAHLPGINYLEQSYTNSTYNLKRAPGILLSNKTFETIIPAQCIFSLTGHADVPVLHTPASSSSPEPPSWYAGDIHVHRNCGDDKVLPEDQLPLMMEPNDLAVISVLADMGNGEVKDSKKDLHKVNGVDAMQSKPGRIIRWDTEWHWDATYSQFSNQALGGHLVLLGLKHAHQIWKESPYKILEWGKKQNAVQGFAHLQYLNDTIQDELNCCIPIDYPVEMALGSIDFISEDVFGRRSPNYGTFNSEAFIHAYYRLLNCGFRPGLAAGTDYPCNNNEPLGTLLTYVQVKDNLTYEKWIQGIKRGRTVISRNGHQEFLDMHINGRYTPGDELKLKNNNTVAIHVIWTANAPLSGTIELVQNGNVIASQSAHADQGAPVEFNATAAFDQSGWICARRMDSLGHQVHTAPVYINVGNKQVRASAEDASYYIAWIDHLLMLTAPGGPWSKYFPRDLASIRTRYKMAKHVYENILKDCKNEKFNH